MRMRPYVQCTKCERSGQPVARIKWDDEFGEADSWHPLNPDLYEKQDGDKPKHQGWHLLNEQYVRFVQRHQQEVQMEIDDRYIRHGRKHKVKWFFDVFVFLGILYMIKSHMKPHSEMVLMWFIFVFYINITKIRPLSWRWIFSCPPCSYTTIWHKTTGIWAPYGV